MKRDDIVLKTLWLYVRKIARKKSALLTINKAILIMFVICIIFVISFYVFMYLCIYVIMLLCIYVIMYLGYTYANLSFIRHNGYHMPYAVCLMYKWKV